MGLEEGREREARVGGGKEERESGWEGQGKGEQG